ncbi:MAG: hypothetical protein E7637_06550 [Ruminococcaceae bacterium]|nr:hypothetical protein [Oscillospiraceae bacterium]
MEEFRSYLPDAVIDKNLAASFHRLTEIAEQEHAHIAELAEEILADCTPTSDFIASLPDRRLPLPTLSGDIPPENAEVMRQLPRQHAVWRSVLLARLIRKGLGLRATEIPEFYFPDFEEIPQAAASRVIYQRTAFADHAYHRFSKALDQPKALYTHHFSMACEEVARGSCEYCILPLENSAEGPLQSFARLIDRFSLKIVAVCDISTDDASRTTRFALLRKNLLPLRGEIGNDTVFECTVPVTEGATVSDLLLAASFCNLSLLRIETKSQTKENLATHFAFSVGHGDLSTYLLYLSIEAPDYEALGIYSPLSTPTILKRI